MKIAAKLQFASSAELLYKKLKPKIAIIGLVHQHVFMLYTKNFDVTIRRLIMEHGVLIDLVQNIQILSTL